LTALGTQITELYFWFVKRRRGGLFALFITVQQWERERRHLIYKRQVCLP
jgi:hypothetical protein